jgi:acyl-coenzyme A synthetase/AMP-(fatty) acid ligase/thioesterase domain-containing protein/acyl carrier protein
VIKLHGVKNKMENVLQAIEAQAKLNPDRIAMGTEHGSITYRKLLLQARSLATALLTEAPEGIVAFSGLFGIERFVAVLGCLWAGRAFLPLSDSGNVSQEVAKQCAVVFVIGAQLPGWSSRPLDELLQYSPLKEPVRRAAKTTAWITTTSGSTGSPKCVPENNLPAAVVIQIHIDEKLVKSGDVVATLGAAWHHISLASLMVGATLEVFDVQNKGPAGLLDWLEARGITNVHTYTAMFRLLLSSHTRLLPKLQTVCVFGEPLRDKEFAGFNLLTPKGARLINGYGSTEIGLISQFIYSNGNPVPHGPIPVGYAFPSVKIEIIDISGIKVPTGELGEITIRSVQVPDGYIGMKSDAFVHGPTGVEYFRTGDIGRLDLTGNLTVLGRLDDMVKIRGTQVLLKDVQTTLESHPSINETMVTRYFRSDGEPRLCAHLVADFQIGLPELVRYLKLRHVETPSTLFHYGALPRTRTGKVDRRALAQPQETAASLSPNETEMISRLRAIWSEVIRQDNFHADARLEDIGGDSHDAMRILLLLEERLGRKIRLDEAIFDGFSLNNLARSLSEPTGHEQLTIFSAALSKKTIFALPVADGSITHMVPLLKEISSSFSVIAIRPKGLAGVDRAVSRIKDLGKNAAQTILDHGCAEGAILVGFSAGATSAFETARHLQNAGYRLGGLILLDPPAQWSRVMPEARAVLGPLIRQGDWSWAKRGAVSLLGGAGFDIPSDAARFAWLSYRATPLRIAVPTLIVAAQVARSSHAKAAWRSVLGEQLEVIDVPGDHVRFLRPPLDCSLVDKIEKWIEKLGLELSD